MMTETDWRRFALSRLIKEVIQPEVNRIGEEEYEGAAKYRDWRAAWHLAEAAKILNPANHPKEAKTVIEISTSLNSGDST